MIKPIRRSPALVQFSKDHHFALLLVWKIRQGLRFHVETYRIGRYINFFFANNLERHFKEEEELLFVHLSKQDQMRVKAEKDHQLLQQLNEDIKSLPSLTTGEQFANTLEAHIRFEERLLFAHLQSSLEESQLDFVLEKMEAVCSSQKEDEWKDTFWTRKNAL